MTLDRIPYRLESDLIALVSYDPRDPTHARELFEAIDESRDHLGRFMGWAAQHETVDDTRGWIRTMRGKFELMTDFAFGIFRRSDGRLVGGAGLHARGEPTVVAVEIGYWVRTSETQKGYAREAARLLTNAAFELGHAERVVIRAQIENRYSRRIPEALGYVEEGVARRSIRLAGTGRDAVVYSMIVEEYQPR